MHVCIYSICMIIHVCVRHLEEATLCRHNQSTPETLPHPQALHPDAGGLVFGSKKDDETWLKKTAKLTTKSLV